MTPLLCVLVSLPARPCRSSTQTERPRAAMKWPHARPVTPAPITATSISSTRLPRNQRKIQDGAHRVSHGELRARYGRPCVQGHLTNAGLGLCRPIGGKVPREDFDIENPLRSEGSREHLP